MTSETPNLHVSKNLNISKTKQDIEKLKTPLGLVWKCCSVVFKIGSKVFSLQWHFKDLRFSISIFKKRKIGWRDDIKTAFVVHPNMELFPGVIVLLGHIQLIAV